MKKLNFNESVKIVKNKLRKYKCISIINNLIILLDKSSNSNDKIESLKYFPWIVCLLVKIVLEDELIHINTGKECPQEVVIECVNLIWSAQSIENSSSDDPGVAYRSLRSLLQGQLIFQTGESWNFLRWPALVSDLPKNHPCYIFFIDRFGVDPERFMEILTILHEPVLKNKLWIELKYFSPIINKIGEDFIRVLNEFSRDVYQLRKELIKRKKENNLREKPPYEMNEQPWLMKYPIFKFSEEVLRIWHPDVFCQGMEVNVHRRLSEIGGGYSQEFGKVFEKYVVKQLKDANIEYLSEDDYWTVVGKNNNAMEAIVSDGNTNILIDAKLTVYSEYAAIHTEYALAWQSLKRVREAINQGWNVSEKLSQINNEWICTKAKENYLFVITSQQFFCCTGEHLRRIFKSDVFDPNKNSQRKQKTPTNAQLNILPVSNIVIMSIDEWEQLIKLVENGVINIFDFSRKVVEANKDSLTSVMVVSQILEKISTNRYLSKTVLEAKNKVLNDVKKYFT